MLRDTSTVLWKEWRELLRQRGSLRAFLIGLLVPIVVFGLMLPLQTGLDWLFTPISLSAWVYMPTIVVMTMMADSFAGERERHTLETLLASRLSDQSILFGKIGAAVSYAMLLALSIAVVGLITVNVAFGAGSRLLWYSAPIFWAGAVASLLVSILGASVGVLVSLRTSTVRQATQTISYIMLILFFVPFVLFELLPPGLLHQISELLRPLRHNLEAAAFIAALVLFLLDIGLIFVAMVRFQRTKLTLD